MLKNLFWHIRYECEWTLVVTGHVTVDNYKLLLVERCSVEARRVPPFKGPVLVQQWTPQCRMCGAERITGRRSALSTTRSQTLWLFGASNYLRHREDVSHGRKGSILCIRKTKAQNRHRRSVQAHKYGDGEQGGFCWLSWYWPCASYTMES